MLSVKHKPQPSRAISAEQITQIAGNSTPYDLRSNILELYRYTALGEVSGYYMYKYRHYAPELGRWPSRDSIEEEGGVNLYGFVNNQATRYWDSLGLAVETCEDIRTFGASYMESRISKWLGIQVRIGYSGSVSKCSMCCSNGRIAKYTKVEGKAEINTSFQEKAVMAVSEF